MITQKQTYYADTIALVLFMIAILITGGVAGAIGGMHYMRGVYERQNAATVGFKCSSVTVTIPSKSVTVTDPAPTDEQ